MLLLVLSFIFAFQANPDSLLRPRAALSFEFLKGNGNVEDTHFPMLSSDLPFWMHANQLGRVDPSSSNIIARLQVAAPLVRREQFRFDGYFDGQFRLASEYGLADITEGYLSAQYGAVRIDAGRRSLPAGLGYHPLSIGTMMMGTDAIPPLGIHVSTPDFVPVPHTQGYLHVSALFGNSWLNDPRYVNDAMLHRKHLYLRLDLFGFEGYGGIVHNAMWGGTHPTLGRLPSTAGDFVRVVFGRPGTDPRIVRDLTNSMGNQMAAYDFMLGRRMPGWSFSASRLFYLEDKVSMRFRSPWDGQWGARILIDPDRSPALHSIVYDHVYTIRQDAKPGEAYGRANYFNHGTYRSGYTSFRRSLSLPIFMSYQSGPFNGIDNNMVVAHHLGVGGNPTHTIAYELRTTYSRNYGTRSRGTPGRQGVLPRPDRRLDEWMLSFDMVWSPELTRLHYTLGVASDLPGETWGFKVGLRIGELTP